MNLYIPTEYAVIGVPTLKLFRNEQVVETLHRYQSEQDLKKVLDLYVTIDSDLILGKAIQLYGEGAPILVLYKKHYLD